MDTVLWERRKPQSEIKIAVIPTNHWHEVRLQRQSIILATAVSWHNLQRRHQTNLEVYLTRSKRKLLKSHALSSSHFFPLYISLNIIWVLDFPSTTPQDPLGLPESLNKDPLPISAKSKREIILPESQPPSTWGFHFLEQRWHHGSTSTRDDEAPTRSKDQGRPYRTCEVVAPPSYWGLSISKSVEFWKREHWW